MEPIAETEQAVDEFMPLADDADDLRAKLRRESDLVRQVVPTCVGLSLASMQHGVTFTLVASDAEIAALDGLQYVGGGPCVDAVLGERVETFTHDGDLIDERGWQLFAQGTAAANIASTLTLPILAGGTVVGSINLYASTPDGFAGHHEAVAEIFHAWAPGAVTNADLTFRTRRVAQQAPAILRKEVRITIAVGIIAVVEQTDVDDAESRFRDAADRAGLDPAQFAEVVISLRGRWTSP